jgi:hypothetical protein
MRSRSLRGGTDRNEVLGIGHTDGCLVRPNPASVVVHPAVREVSEETLLRVRATGIIDSRAHPLTRVLIVDVAGPP